MSAWPVTHGRALQIRTGRIRLPRAQLASARTYCATDLNGHSGFRTPEQGAAVSVHLATLPADGPSGVLWGHLWTTDGPEAYGVLPW